MTTKYDDTIILGEVIDVKVFICETCDAGDFGINESARSSGNILKFHQGLGHKIKFFTAKKDSKFWKGKNEFSKY